MLIRSRNEFPLTLSPVFLIALLFTVPAWGATCPSSPRPPTTFYVRTTGSDANDGLSADKSFQKIQTGVDCLSVPGDRLFIFGGTYTEFVTVAGKNGTPDKPIVILGEPVPGLFVVPPVRIQAGITHLSTKTQHFEYRFHTAPNNEWEKITDTIADEYISKQ